jgi:hypothetical protein
MSELVKIDDSNPIDKYEQIRSQLEATRNTFNSLLKKLTIEDVNRPNLYSASISDPMPGISKER